jgi:hypothetical protein
MHAGAQNVPVLVNTIGNADQDMDAEKMRLTMG